MRHMRPLRLLSSALCVSAATAGIVGVVTTYAVSTDDTGGEVTPSQSSKKATLTYTDAFAKAGINLKQDQLIKNIKRSAQNIIPLPFTSLEGNMSGSCVITCDGQEIKREAIRFIDGQSQPEIIIVKDDWKQIKKSKSEWTIDFVRDAKQVQTISYSSQFNDAGITITKSSTLSLTEEIGGTNQIDINYTAPGNISGSYAIVCNGTTIKSDNITFPAATSVASTKTIKITSAEWSQIKTTDPQSWTIYFSRNRKKASNISFNTTGFTNAYITLQSGSTQTLTEPEDGKSQSITIAYTAEGNMDGSYVVNVKNESTVVAKGSLHFGAATTTKYVSIPITSDNWANIKTTDAKEWVISFTRNNKHVDTINFDKASFTTDAGITAVATTTPLVENQSLQIKYSATLGNMAGTCTIKTSDGKTTIYTTPSTITFGSSGGTATIAISKDAWDKVRTTDGQSWTVYFNRSKKSIQKVGFDSKSFSNDGVEVTAVSPTSDFKEGQSLTFTYTAEANISGTYTITCSGGQKITGTAHFKAGQNTITVTPEDWSAIKTTDPITSCTVSFARFKKSAKIKCHASFANNHLTAAPTEAIIYEQDSGGTTSTLSYSAPGVISGRINLLNYNGSQTIWGNVLNPVSFEATKAESPKTQDIIIPKECWDTKVKTTDVQDWGFGLVANTRSVKEFKYTASGFTDAGITNVSISATSQKAGADMPVKVTCTSPGNISGTCTLTFNDTSIGTKTTYSQAVTFAAGTGVTQTITFPKDNWSQLQTTDPVTCTVSFVANKKSAKTITYDATSFKALGVTGVSGTSSLTQPNSTLKINYTASAAVTAKLSISNGTTTIYSANQTFAKGTSSVNVDVSSAWSKITTTDPQTWTVTFANSKTATLSLSKTIGTLDKTSISETDTSFTITTKVSGEYVYSIIYDDQYTLIKNTAYVNIANVGDKITVNIGASEWAKVESGHIWAISFNKLSDSWNEELEYKGTSYAYGLAVGYTTGGKCTFTANIVSGLTKIQTFSTNLRDGVKYSITRKSGTKTTTLASGDSFEGSIQFTATTCSVGDVITITFIAGELAMLTYMEAILS